MINICFHGIGEPARTLEPNEDRYWISSELYEQIVEEVAGRTDVELSFDDGNASDAEIGLEPLVRTGRTAAFFVLAARLDQPGSLSTAQLHQLRDHGMLIGSHGMDHVPWRHLDRSQQQREFVEAREAIATAASRPVRQAALPLGRYDRQVLRELRRLGYERVFTSDRAHTRSSAWLQPRFSVHAEDTIDSIRDILRPLPWRRSVPIALKGVVKRLR